MSRKSRLLWIVSYSILIQEPINCNNYFYNKIHLLPELAIHIAFYSIVTLCIICKSDDICNKLSLMYGDTVGAKSLSPVIVSWHKKEKCMSFIKRMQLSA